MTYEEYSKINPRKSTKQPDHIMLSICGDAKHEMCVTWRTSRDIETGYMLISEADKDEFRRVDAVNKEVKTDIDVNMNHWAKPKNLSPGTKYKYTVGNDEYRSGEYTFTTEKENVTKFKFLFFTDQQREDPYLCPDYSVQQELLKDAFSRHPDIDFILTGGDNTNNGENELQWNGMFSGLEGYIESIPFMMTVGNHDSRGYADYFGEDVKKYYAEKAFLFDAQFAESYPKNGPDGLIGENYSFDYGNAHFTVVSVNYQDKLGDWLYNDVKNSDKTWKIGSYHFPIYPVMPEGVNDDSYPWLRKGIEEGRFDVLFAGHEHSFARTYPMTDKGMFEKPSEGVVHFIAGNGGRNIFNTNCRKIWHPKFYPQEVRQYLYMICEIDGDKLTITSYLEDGRTIDYFVLDKGNDSIFPPEPAPVFNQTKMSFKGIIPELAVREQPCEQKDGVFFCAFGSLARANGGVVVKDGKKMSIDFYGHKAELIEGTDIANTPDGQVKLEHEVYRGRKNQLYISVPDCEKLFGVHHQYYEYNNLINFDYDAEKAYIDF
jgi:hypothetical protein